MLGRKKKERGALGAPGTLQVCRYAKYNGYTGTLGTVGSSTNLLTGKSINTSFRLLKQQKQIAYVAYVVDWNSRSIFYCLCRL